MKPTLTLTSPDISDINKLFEIYLTLPDRDELIDNLSQFYSFLQKNSKDRQAFLDAHCVYDFMSIGKTVILKVSPK